MSIIIPLNETRCFKAPSAPVFPVIIGEVGGQVLGTLTSPSSVFCLPGEVEVEFYYHDKVSCKPHCEPERIDVEASVITDNTDSPDEICIKQEQLDAILTAIAENSGKQTVVLPDVCVNVSGEPQVVIPILTVNADNGAILSITHVDARGNLIDGDITAAEPCDCDCLGCEESTPPAFGELARRCVLYTSLGSSYTFGPGGFLSDPSIFDDPPPPGSPPGFDFTCTNMYPINVVFEDAAFSTDGGATWTHFTPATVSYNSPADVNFRDDGYGLGWSDFADAINTHLVGQGVRLMPNVGNGGVWEYEVGADETTHLVRVAWHWEITGGNCAGANGVDPFQLEWAQEWQLTATDGQWVATSNGNAATSGFNVEDGPASQALGSGFDVPIESCEDV